MDSGQVCYSLLRVAGVTLPLFIQLTEQKERMTLPAPKLCSTSPVLISVLHIKQLASLLCACSRAAERHTVNRVTM